jgi:acyl-CoA dehydrogenase
MSKIQPLRHAATRHASTQTRYDIQDVVQRVCAKFGSTYWRKLDEETAYPTEFVREWTSAGLTSIQIPQNLGGLGLGLMEVAMSLEKAHRLGCNCSAVHAQLYMTNTLVKLVAEPTQLVQDLVAGRKRIQAFGVTEPSSGSDTAAITTRAEQNEDGWVINGGKIWTSRIEHSDFLMLLARTSAGRKRHEGLSLFLIDIHDALAKNTIQIRKIPTLMNHSTCQVFFSDLTTPASSLLGKEGEGFKYLLESLNSERILIAAECIGDGLYGLEKAVEWAKTRQVFGRPIGANQGVAFPIAKAYMELEAARTVMYKAAGYFDDKLEDLGTLANSAKYLASHASFQALDTCIQTMGGMGFAKEADVERKWRENRLYQVAPISDNLILSYIAEKTLGLPRSY